MLAYKVSHLPFIFIRIVVIRLCVGTARREPYVIIAQRLVGLVFVSRIHVVERKHHCRRHIIVRRAVDIEHRRVLLAQLTERRRLAERPAVAQLAEYACHMKHRKIGQMELVAELTAELVPYTREAAVFNKTADAVRKILARRSSPWRLPSTRRGAPCAADTWCCGTFRAQHISSVLCPCGLSTPSVCRCRR